MTKHCSFFPAALAAVMLPAMASAQTTPGNPADATPAAASAPAPARDIGGIWEPLSILDGIQPQGGREVSTDLNVVMPYTALGLEMSRR